MKTKRVVVVSAFVVVLGLSSMASADLWNTGVDDSGVALPDNTPDPHYTLTSVPSGPSTALAITGNKAWVTPPADARWIAPTAGDTSDPREWYVFETVFDVASPDAFAISGKWATDNDAQIWLNGADTGITRDFGTSSADYSFTFLEDFQISSGFLPGQNTLQFRVWNGYHDRVDGAGPMGLLVSDVAITPVPGAVLLGMLGLSVAGAKLRRKRT